MRYTHRDVGMAIERAEDAGGSALCHGRVIEGSLRHIVLAGRKYAQEGERSTRTVTNAFP